MYQDNKDEEAENALNILADVCKSEADPGKLIQEPLSIDEVLKWRQNAGGALRPAVYTGNSKRTFFRKKKREKQIDDAANAKGQKKSKI